MAAQASANGPGEPMGYGFLPGVQGRGGSAVAAPPPLLGPRRLRTQSVSGDTGQKFDVSDLSTDMLVSPRSASTLQLPTRSPTSSSFNARGGSADRHHHPSHSASSTGGSGVTNNSNGGGMPQLVTVLTSVANNSSSGIGGAGTPAMRHSISGAATVGLPRLEHPSVYGSVELPSLGAMTAARRSLNGCTADGFTAATSAVGSSVPPSLSLSDSAGWDCSLPMSPRQGAPTVLAPLRGPLQAPGGAALGLAATPGAVSPSPTAAAGVPSEASSPSTLGWCGGPVSYSNGGNRRYGNPDIALPLPLPTPSYDPAPLTPAALRRSCSLTSRPGVALGASLRTGLSVSLSGEAADSTGAAVPWGPIPEHDHGDPNSPIGGSSAALLSEAADDLQHAAGLLLALHGAVPRPRSAAGPRPAVAVPLAPPPPLTVPQLEQLRSSAPELHADVRIALRRVFQVLRHELSGLPSTGSTSSSLSGAAAAADGSSGAGGAGAAGGGGGLSGTSLLASCVQECWVTLDAFLEGTADLTSSLVKDVLQARRGVETGVPSTTASPASDGVAPALGASGGGGGAGAVPTDVCAVPASLAAVYAPCGGEFERLQALDEEVQLQVEECRRQLAAEARAAAAGGSAAADQDVPGPPARVTSAAGGLHSPSGLGPRPPVALASPPLQCRCSTSPRRGKYARAQPLRGGEATLAGGNSSASGAARGSGVDSAGGGVSSCGDGTIDEAPLCNTSRGRQQPAVRSGSDGSGSGAGSKTPDGIGASGAELQPPRFDRAAVLARGPSRGEDMVIEEDASDDADDDDAASDDEASDDPRRHMMTFRSASFAEWVRGGGGRRPGPSSSLQ